MSDARERLRHYLEQRRELGERELVLDGMNVEDVMRLLGAGGAGAMPRRPRAPELVREAPTASADVATDDHGAPADHPRLRGEGEPSPVELPAVRPQYEPELAERGGAAREFSLDEAQTGDWRAMLRAAGSVPGAPPAAANTADADRGDAVSNGEPADTRSQSVAPAPAAPSTVPSPEAPRRSVAGSVVSGALYPGLDLPVGVIAGAGEELFGGDLSELASLDDVARLIAACTRCPLYRTATHPVPGEGNSTPELVVVGEAPGADEDASGRPFVGASGQLLTKILAAIKLAREDVFIANVVKHRPPGNRNPTPDEVTACSPYLVRQLELLRPKAILTVGNFAAQTLLGTKLGIGKLRGQVHLYRGVPLVATYHPAALLRNEAWKRPTWEDVKLVRRLLDLAADPG